MISQDADNQLPTPSHRSLCLCLRLTVTVTHHYSPIEKSILELLTTSEREEEEVLVGVEQTCKMYSIDIS